MKARASVRAASTGVDRRLRRALADVGGSGALPVDGALRFLATPHIPSRAQGGLLAPPRELGMTAKPTLAHLCGAFRLRRTRFAGKTRATL